MSISSSINTPLRIGALVAAFVLAGCSSTKLDSDVPVENRAPNAAGTGGAGTGANAGGASQSQIASIDLTKSRNNAAVMANLPHTVYFDFDSYVVKDDYRGVVEANAKALTADRAQHMVVEGHTDDRGGREYNLALGQKRAESVVKSLELLGVNDNQLEAVSFGKERPAAQGDDEAAWAKNRRAELVAR